MSKRYEIVEENINNNFNEALERTIYMKLVNFYDKEHSKDIPLYFYYHLKSELEDFILSNHTWERTREGFETRRNFNFDPNSRDITYTRYKILKTDNGYVSDGSDIANKHFSNYQKGLEALAKIEEFIHSLYLEHKDKIDIELNARRKMQEYREESIKDRIYTETTHTQMYLWSYGQEGIEILIKWLNRLNEPSVNINDLVEDFYHDVTELKEYFITTNNSTYLEREKYSKFEYVLLTVLQRYSPRGSELKNKYHMLYEDVDLKRGK